MQSKFKRCGARRLLKLAAHLEAGPKKAKWAHKRFDFGIFDNYGDSGDLFGPKNVCGTAGCAVGECPAVFPKDFKFKSSLSGVYIALKGSAVHNLNAAAVFFDLSDEEAQYLFMPGGAPWFGNEYRNYLTGRKATAKQVAKHIRKFVAKKLTEIG